MIPNENKLISEILNLIMNDKYVKTQLSIWNHSEEPTCLKNNNFTLNLSKFKFEIFFFSFIKNKFWLEK
jgi:hypothetical protein